jgi:phosphoribosylaminoimidazole-succinocarboxamide synthase
MASASSWSISRSRSGGSGTATLRLVVADEISPDSCRLWDIETGPKLDKDVFRRDLGSLTDAYTEVARRLGVLPSNVTHRPKPTLIN